MASGARLSSAILRVVASSRARWHHYVPRLHLRLFADDAARAFIYEHDKLVGRTRRRAIKSVAAEMDFYTLVGPDGLPSDALERSLSLVESDAARVLQRLARLPAGSLTTSDEDRVRLAAYIALQYSRVPSQLEPNRQTTEFLGSAAMDMIFETAEHYRDFNRGTMGSTASDAELEAERVAGLEMLRSGSWQVPGAREQALSAIKMAVDSIIPFVAAMKWTILRRTRPPWLILGDTPVTLFKENRDPHMGIGSATEGVEVHMPLSPTHAFVATATDTLLAERVVDFHGEEMADGMNVETWAYSVGAVYGNTAEVIEGARKATPEDLRGYREPVAHIGGGPREWDRYKPRRQRPQRPQGQ
jgi:Protein of unknown function (DUF4238)